MAASRKSKDYDWAFDLRAFDYDSDSSAESLDEDTNPPVGSRLKVQLEDFSFYAREESVSYKPNPFSIAKINAAYRSAKNGIGRTEATDGLPQKTHKACKLVQTKIDVVLKNQVPKPSKHFVPTKDHTISDTLYDSNIAHINHPKLKIEEATSVQLVEKSNLSLAESHPVCSGFYPSTEPSRLSENAHIVTGVAESRVFDEPLCTISSRTSDNGYVKHEVSDPELLPIPYASPSRSAISTRDLFSEQGPAHSAVRQTSGLDPGYPVLSNVNPLGNQIKQGPFRMFLKSIHLFPLVLQNFASRLLQKEGRHVLSPSIRPKTQSPIFY